MNRSTKKVGSLVTFLLFMLSIFANLLFFSQNASASTKFEATWNTGSSYGLTNTLDFPLANVTGYSGSGLPQANQAASGTQGITAHQGNGYLQVAGKDTSTTANSYAYHRIYEKVNITVMSGMHMKYWVYHYAHTTTSPHMGFDLLFSDGTYLRDLGLLDSNGASFHPANRNEAMNQWVQVDVDLSPLAGKVIQRIVVAYDDNVNANTGQYVSYFDDFTLETATAAATTNPRTLTPVNSTDDLVVYTVNATEAPYSADNTGVNDAAPAIQSALNACFSQGGGVVWLPAGKYRMDTNIVIPNHCTLRGDWRDPDSGSGNYGTVIMAYYGANMTKSDPGLIQIAASGGVKGLTVFYPNQDIANVTPYAYTFEIFGDSTVGGYNGYMSSSIQNVTMLNSYRGIIAGYRSTHELHEIRNVKGTALNNAIALYNSADVGKVNQVKFKSDYWSGMDLTQFAGYSLKPTDSQVTAYTRANGTGLEIGDLEWSQMNDVALNDYNIGIHIVPGVRAVGYTPFSGMMYGMSVLNSHIGLLVDPQIGGRDSLDTRVGLTISNSTIKANQGIDPVAVKIQNNNGASIIFNTCTIGGGALNAVQLLGNTMASFHNTTFDSWTDTYAISASGGTLILEGSTFVPVLSATKKGANLQAGLSSAAILGSVISPAGSANLVANNAPLADVTRNDSLVFATHGVGAYLAKSSLPRPTNSNFYNVKDYGAAGTTANANPTVDDTAAFNAALAAAAAAGGGTVYVPPGIYRIDGHLTVGANVQLRGSDDIPHRAAVYGSATGSILYAYEGRGTSTPDTDAPLILLNGNNSGVRGLSINYPDQATDSAANIAAYPWAIRGAGDGVYAFDIGFVNAYKGVYLGSGGTADNHYINQVVGTVLREGIRIENSSVGWIEDNLFNITGWGRAYGMPNQLNEVTTMFPVAGTYTKTNLKAYTVNNSALDERMINNFVYSSQAGFTYWGNAHATAINSAHDGGIYLIDSQGSAVLNMINLQGCGCGNGGNAINIGGGTVNLFNVLTMEAYGKAISQTGGSLTLQGAAFHHGLATVSGGTVVMNGVLFRDSGTDVTLTGSTTATLIGNIGGNGFNISGASTNSNNIRR
ncbi:hypothetical protein Back11_50170 [Paenibacillus baekrokdamisoli]|uniref:Rhamnogalacturonase A/B/Epimerase-like pectate lyase domain-containing protein n=1 Tax=Paenibacillus baekrokdamisoli TaxID=1712516 RepID=A0A3G9IZG8_9BACL|nr:glycosyl hydrolase family 28-related protein [Paenibacillus baekrokdamisoli]MBB3068846.1 hypothetical protein [Paenibacillus baekrokdamisoli]BBH23672.1 hypothetical protein Back11_50170 [Paenibacillus baekrokdamisoli]